MTDKLLKVSRRFANTVIYFRVPAAQVDEANAHFAGFEDSNPGCHASWVSGEGLGDKPVMWSDRAWVGY